MNILIVHAHPEPLSFTTSLKNLAVEELQQQGHDVEVSDLYAMNFNPVASREDFLELDNSEYFNYALEQRSAFKQQKLAPDIQIEINKIQKSRLGYFKFSNVLDFCSRNFKRLD